MPWGHPSLKRHHSWTAAETSSQRCWQWYNCPMPNVEANAIRIEYDTFGAPTARPLLLIMGLGQPMLLWHEDFCQQLADQGHFVIRFDNRDVGLSTSFHEVGTPNKIKTAVRYWTRRRIEPAYTLGDMADDASGLLDALKIERAHLVGVSMGGMIAQVFATRHPARILSLTSIMSSTGNPKLPQARLKVLPVILGRPPTERQAFINFSVRLWRTIGSPGYPFREEIIRQRSGRIFDRRKGPTGVARQLVAIAAAGDRRQDVAKIGVPTLVIHGEDDPLVRVEGGRETARLIPNAELLTFEGMGHDLPLELWHRVVSAISAHTLGGC